ncbi:MAG: hypothetical protein ABIP97_02135 [Chthoniobacterales bacterium]
MNFARIMRFWMLSVAFGICLSSVFAQSAPSGSENRAKSTDKEFVRTLMGKLYSGKIEFRDDYTLRISNDLGISNVPIAELDEINFKKYGFKKDRSQDGRFWAERKAALGQAMIAMNNRQGEAIGKERISGGGAAGISSSMKELGPFQGLIDKFEKSDSKNFDSTATANASPGSSPVAANPKPAASPLTSLFGTPGGMPTDLIRPVIQAGSAAVGVGVPSMPDFSSGSSSP